MNRAQGFAAVPTWMIRDKAVPRNAVLVYASLSSRAGLGVIYPSQATIAEESGLSERTVRTMLRELERLGVVRRERRTVPGARRATDAYSLHPNGLPAESAASSDLAADLPATEAASTGNELQATPSIEVENVEVENEVGPRKRGTRIPEPFLLTADMKAWAAAEVPGLDVIAHTREFVDHWRAASGASATKLDWVATWRNWMRKAHRWQGARGAKPMPVERAQSVLEIGARLQQQADAREQRAVSA